MTGKDVAPVKAGVGPAQKFHEHAAQIFGNLLAVVVVIGTSGTLLGLFHDTGNGQGVGKHLVHGVYPALGCVNVALEQVKPVQGCSE